ncbi:MAG: amidohydrolase family protein [Ramlibacter sp.]
MPRDATPLVLRGGKVIDGSGNPAFQADVAVADGVIQAILAPGASARGDTVDATGMVVCPGFIDTHAHDDLQVLQGLKQQPKLSQGVTTVVTGNCGISLAPLVHPGAPAPLDLLGAHSYRYATFRDYLQQLDAARPAVNVVPLVGHITVRVARVADLQREASAGEIRAMRADISAALDAGAFGLSTGVYYPPAQAATAHELEEVCRALKGRNAVLAMHIRDEGDHVDAALKEALDVSHDCGARLVLSHHKVVGPRNHGRTKGTLALVEAAAQHRDVCVDCYPYEASSTMLDVDKAVRIQQVLISWSQPFPHFAGRALADIAHEWGTSLAQAAQRLMPGGAIYFGMAPDDVDRVVSHPLAMFGSDGLPHDSAPHPRLWGTFPRVLGHYSRERGLLPLPLAVHKMTGLPARRFGLRGRGLISEGYCADLVVFDPATVRDNATYQNPTAPPSGIHAVIVNGRLAQLRGRAVDLHAGQRLIPAP